MRPSTDIIHGSTGGSRDADPLTTPIYETTTFVFENAGEVKAFNEGKSRKYLYSRYGNPTVVAVEQTIARIEGADIVMESVTKYLNGHSDVTAGALAGPARLMKDVDKARRLLGGIIDPQAAYAIGRGIKTLSVRMERHNANGMAVAAWLETQRG